MGVRRWWDGARQHYKQQAEHRTRSSAAKQQKLGTYGSRLACHGTRGRRADRQTRRLLRPYCTLFRAQLDSPCPFTLAARPNTIIRDLGRGVPMRGAATFLASPWGGGSGAARAGQARCVAATTQHTTRGAWRPWITLGRAPHWCGLGLPAARAATRKKPKDETRTAIVTSSTFLASHPSAPGGSFAFGMMKCHASCTLPGRGSVRVTGQASVPVARCSTLFFLS